MILVFDVGNTNIVLGIYQGEKLINHWRIMTNVQRTSDEYGMFISSFFQIGGLNMQDVKAIVVSSVVPSLVTELVWMAEKYFSCKALLVGPGIKTGLALKYE
ncbi:MAG: type III pantothenate kinase, partial [Syntrophomonadaceae bacterium]|nr:type III pantothenate kinase [Syntrophomonadaceae bacterium]